MFNGQWTYDLPIFTTDSPKVQLWVLSEVWGSGCQCWWMSEFELQIPPWNSELQKDQKWLSPDRDSGREQFKCACRCMGWGNHWAIMITDGVDLLWWCGAMIGVMDQHWKDMRSDRQEGFLNTVIPNKCQSEIKHWKQELAHGTPPGMGGRREPSTVKILKKVWLNFIIKDTVTRIWILSSACHENQDKFIFFCR